jgi:hypothetical protein
MCDGYVLPTDYREIISHYLVDLELQLPAGSSVNTSQTIYVYAQNGTAQICTDEESFDSCTYRHSL